MASRRFGCLVVPLLLVPAVGLPSESEPPPAPQRVLLESVGFSVNRLGLQNALELKWVWPLTASRNPLLAGAHFSVGLSHTLTPSYTRLGAWLEVSPLSILDVRAGVEPAAYFGTFGSLMSFSRYDEPFGDDVRRARKDEARAGTGSRLHVTPTLKMKAGQIVAVCSTSFEWWRSSEGDPLYYEPARDTLLEARGDRLLTLSAVVLRVQAPAGGGLLRYGASYDLTYLPAWPGNRSQQVGLVASRGFAGRRFRLTDPTIGARVWYYSRDPSRKGQLGAAIGISLGWPRARER